MNKKIMKVFGTDFDGVIINIEPQKARFFGKILKEEWDVAEKSAEKFWVDTGGFSRRFKFNHFFQKKFNRRLTDQEYKIIEKRFREGLKNIYYPNIRLLPQALTLLQTARSRFDYLFVSSGVPMEEIKFLVKITGVAKFFNLVLGTNKKFPSKKEHFEYIVKNKKPDKLVFIADGLKDMQVSQAFGAVSIGVPSNHSKKELLAAGANYVVNLPEAITIIKNLFGNPRKK